MSCEYNFGVAPSRSQTARTLGVMLIATLCLAARAAAFDSLQLGGFALLRPQTQSTGVPLDEDPVSAQVQLGVDWRPAPAVGAHVHLLARNDEDGSRRGRVGIVEAFVEANANVGTSNRLRLLGGAFFLPTSRENIDALWESPYTITPSALNSWMGEEFRPIGIDASWRHRLDGGSALTGGATIYRGNDTFGALPIDRGWALTDRWALLGEHLYVNGRVFTSISAETDGRLGWSARGKWNNDRGAIQLTRIDNRSDARQYGDLLNWATRYNIVGADYTFGAWTVIGEAAWGTTAVERRSGRRSSPIRSSYLLLSRRFSNMRASVRFDEFRGRTYSEALTAALFWEGHPKIRAGIEAIAVEEEERLAVELRYRF
jgi:hypothetical protein